MNFGDVWNGLVEESLISHGAAPTGCPPDRAERPVSGVVIDSRSVMVGVREFTIETWDTILFSICAFAYLVSFAIHHALAPKFEPIAAEKTA